MQAKTLLLNSSYEAIGFITFPRLMKLIFHYNGPKVDIVSEWDNEYIIWPSGKIKYPATVRLKYYVRSVPKKLRFNRKEVFKRDSYICQYCAKALTSVDATIDHIIPQSRGGDSTFSNCVTCCQKCNYKKSNKMLDEVNMKLINIPVQPKKAAVRDFNIVNNKHESWIDYIKM